MALPGSGALSLNDIQTEFGGSNPISISEYYGADTGVPASGTISIDDFYGTSSGPSISIPSWFTSFKAYTGLADGNQTLDLSSFERSSASKIVFVIVGGDECTSWGTTPSGWSLLSSSLGTTYAQYALYGQVANTVGTSISITPTGLTGPVAVAFEVDCSYDSVYTTQSLSGLPDCPQYLNDQSTGSWIGFAVVDADNGNNAYTAGANHDSIITDFGNTVGSKNCHIVIGVKYRPSFGINYNPDAWGGGTSGQDWRAVSLFVFSTTGGP